MRASVVCLALGVLVASSACGGRRHHRTPESALEAFSKALREGDYDAAHRLLAAGYRDEVSRDELRERLERNPDERAELIALLAHPSGESEVTAEVPYGDGDLLRLRLENGHWRIVGNVFDFYDQSTPRAALRSFVRAISRRRYDVVLRFVPRSDSEGMTEERLREAWEGPNRESIARLIENLRENLDNPIVRSGDHATMAYGDRFTAELIFEDGV
ncbi:MAG: hypothetical protein H5U40_03430, partial [Polyangiaceae bacterium]|nr:hypothetical protein [Polyangiaceae bacterium]